MNYRYSICTESPGNERLAALATQAAAQALHLPYTPRAHFFREDAHGKFERPFRVAGFQDYHCFAADLCIFVRSGMAPSQTVSTIFHENFHAHEFATSPLPDRTIAELAADRFALQRAPFGSLERLMTCLKKVIRPVSDAERANCEHARAARELQAQVVRERRQRDFDRTMQELADWRAKQSAKHQKAEDEIYSAIKRARQLAEFSKGVQQQTREARGTKISETWRP
jgi:hypothetical protein